jgi:hypothetical protein
MQINAQAIGYALDQSVVERHQAVKAFDAMMRAGWLKGVVGGLLHHSRRLSDLAAVHTPQQRYEGKQTVSISDICGSEGRTQDFDIEFYPIQEHSRERWISVAVAMLRGVPLPPVELIRVGERYYVRDGHHRISVSRSLGRLDIEAVVTAWNVE